MKTFSDGQPRPVLFELHVTKPSRRKLGVLASAALLGLCAAYQPAYAQAPATPGGSLLVPAPAPVARPELAAFNVLIIAFDEAALKSPVPGAAVPAAPEVTAPGAIVPGNGAPAAITPAAGIPGVVQWRALAQNRKPGKDDDLFRLEPDNRGLTPRPGQNLPPVNPVNPVGPATAGAAPLTGLGEAPRTVEPPGRAQLAALPLRRSLLAMGFGDVMPTAPDAMTIQRAINERRLTPRVLEGLRGNLLQLTQSTAAPKPEDLRPGVLAAARIGQAIGYRVVVALAVTPAAEGGTAYSLLLVDSMRETGEPLLFDEKGTDELAVRDSGGASGAALIEKAVRLWPAVTTSQRAGLASTHLELARAALAKGDTATAQDELNQAVTLDPQRGEVYVLLGDLLQSSDPAAAATAYRRAVDLNARDGATWAKIAVSYTTAKVPDWPRALEAGRKAISLGTDTVPLRTAMATAQFGRADLFRKADRLDRAEDAEFDARQHLDKALELDPDDPSVVRLLAKQLITQGRFDEAAQTLDRIAPRYPKDLEIQTQYAAALTRLPGREEDFFVTSARVWKLAGTRTVDVDASKYRSLAEGFDNRLFNLGKSAAQITTGVANAALPRESALLQLTKLKEDMSEAEAAINLLRPPFSVPADVRDARVFSADLMNQSLENHQMYLETGQDIFRVRGLELYRQSVAQLNQARGGR